MRLLVKWRCRCFSSCIFSSTFCRFRKLAPLVKLLHSTFHDFELFRCFRAISSAPSSRFIFFNVSVWTLKLHIWIFNFVFHMCFFCPIICISSFPPCRLLDAHVLEQAWPRPFMVAFWLYWIHWIYYILEDFILDGARFSLRSGYIVNIDHVRST